MYERVSIIVGLCVHLSIYPDKISFEPMFAFMVPIPFICDKIKVVHV